MLPESHTRGFEVDVHVCATWSWLMTFTVVPTAIGPLSVLNAKLLIVIVTVLWPTVVGGEVVGGVVRMVVGEGGCVVGGVGAGADVAGGTAGPADAGPGPAAGFDVEVVDFTVVVACLAVALAVWAFGAAFGVCDFDTVVLVDKGVVPDATAVLGAALAAR
jgi:hypothetical protein